MKVLYVGFLSSCDHTILELDLRDDFKVEKMDLNEGLRLIATITHTQVPAVSQLAMSYDLINSDEQAVYTISKEGEVTNIEPDKIQYSPDGRRIIPSSDPDFGDQLSFYGHSEEYVREKTRLLRLCGDGSVNVPVHGLMVIGDKTYSNMWGIDGNLTQHLRFHLEDVNFATNFIRNNTLPFLDSELQSAFDAYEWSYTTTNSSLSLISCIIALEILLNPGRQDEISNTVSRNLAALIGTGIADSERIYQDMKKLYKFRSRIVHGGKSGTPSVAELKKSREFARSAIRTWLKASLKRDELHGILRCIGFGEDRPWNKLD